MIPQLLIGHTLASRYRVDALLGHGGMGAVFRAEDLTLHRTVAIKVIALPGGLTADEEESARGRFRREARMAAMLDHPNVVTIFDFGTDATLGLDYLAMQFLHGEDLASRIARGTVPAGEAATILQGIALGLAAGHARGVIHRDVKPGNVFLCTQGTGAARVKLVDFGIAKAVASPETMTRLTKFGASPRSPAYASPEQERGGCELTPASDVFSAARTALAMLLASPRPADEALRRLRANEPGLARILERAVAPDPADRHADGGELAADLEALAATTEERTAPRNHAVPRIDAAARPGDAPRVHAERREGAAGSGLDLEEPRGRPLRIHRTGRPSGNTSVAMAVFATVLFAAAAVAGFTLSGADGASIQTLVQRFVPARGPAEQPSIPKSDPRIQQIRAWFQATERNAARLPRASRPAPDSTVAYLERSGRPLKIVTRERRAGDSIRVTEYFLAGGLPYFVFEHPAGSTTAGSTRYYYDPRGRLVRVLRDGEPAGIVPGETDRAVRTRLALLHASFLQGWSGWNRFDPAPLRIGHVRTRPGCSESYYLASEQENPASGRGVLPVFHDDYAGRGAEVRVEGTAYRVKRDANDPNRFLSPEGLTVTLEPQVVRAGYEGRRVEGMMRMTLGDRAARMRVSGGSGC